MLEMQLAQPDQAQVGKVRFAVGIAFRQRLKLRQVIVEVLLFLNCGVLGR